MQHILTSVELHVATITFNHPETRNSLAGEVLEEMLCAIERFSNDQSVRVLVIRAPGGSKVWSSGFNIHELPVSGRDPLSYNDPLECVLRAIQRFHSPVIAMIEGSVWGGACDLSFVCDIAIGCPSSSFAITPSKLGLPYNISGVMHFFNIVGPRIAREMFYTAEPIPAERALQVGILNHLVPTEDLERFTYAMAHGIAEKAPLANRVMKEQLRLLADAYSLRTETFEYVQGLRRMVYDSSDYNEGKQAFLEKRKPVFTGK
jgi:methylmalonyl-CoA decarboxylase